jgi:hypothetical protein
VTPEVTFVDRPLPPWARARLVALAPGEERAYTEAEWRGALVVVERGTIELECVVGRRWRFEQGAVLWLAGLPLRALRNAGSGPALLSAVSRAG